jgi:hypothetical protein
VIELTQYQQTSHGVDVGNLEISQYPDEPSLQKPSSTILDTSLCTPARRISHDVRYTNGSSTMDEDALSPPNKSPTLSPKHQAPLQGTKRKAFLTPQQMNVKRQMSLGIGMRSPFPLNT